MEILQTPTHPSWCPLHPAAVRPVPPTVRLVRALALGVLAQLLRLTGRARRRGTGRGTGTRCGRAISPPLSSKKLVETSASLLITSALLVVTRSY